jgi:hypothetical protein
MFPPLIHVLAQARTDDLRLAADARVAAEAIRTEARRPPVIEKPVTLRFGAARDENSLARLAALDSKEPPTQPVLLAEVDGQLLAALTLSDGCVIADPFHPTLDLIALLRARACQLNGHSRTRRGGRLRFWARLCASPCRE